MQVWLGPLCTHIEVQSRVSPDSGGVSREVVCSRWMAESMMLEGTGERKVAKKSRSPTMEGFPGFRGQSGCTSS